MKLDFHPIRLVLALVTVSSNVIFVGESTSSCPLRRLQPPPIPHPDPPPPKTKAPVPPVPPKTKAPVPPVTPKTKAPVPPVTPVTKAPTPPPVPRPQPVTPPPIVDDNEDDEETPPPTPTPPADEPPTPTPTIVPTEGTTDAPSAESSAAPTQSPVYEPTVLSSFPSTSPSTSSPIATEQATVPSATPFSNASIIQEKESITSTMSPGVIIAITCTIAFVICFVVGVFGFLRNKKIQATTRAGDFSGQADSQGDGLMPPQTTEAEIIEADVTVTAAAAAAAAAAATSIKKRPRIPRYKDQARTVVEPGYVAEEDRPFISARLVDSSLDERTAVAEVVEAKFPVTTATAAAAAAAAISVRSKPKIIQYKDQVGPFLEPGYEAEEVRPVMSARIEDSSREVKVYGKKKEP